MKSRRLNVSEDRQTILGRHARSSNSSQPIPTDLMMDILSRLSAKSIARCRCVSKLWASILGLPYFTDLFLTKSSAHPKLLFACRKDNELFFLSTPQNPDDESSSPLAATYHMKIPFNDRHSSIVSPICSGLVFTRDEQILKGRKSPELVSVICNPSTGQSFTLPKPKTRRKIWVRRYFGYDPIEKHFKVLSMTERDGISEEHQVLTLETNKKPSWRMIECSVLHALGSEGICINGVLYYGASVNISSRKSMIICFDVRSEKFSYINVMEYSIVHPAATLINYKGKLASVMSEEGFYISRGCRGFEMWVLIDPEKHKWSNYIYKLPQLLWPYHLLSEKLLYFVGVTAGTNEMVLSPAYPSDLYYVLYFSLEKKTIRVVEIQGLGAFKGNRVRIYLDHVEDVKLMHAF